MKWRLRGRALITALNREQSSNTRYLLRKKNKDRTGFQSVKYYFSSSSASFWGVHSNKIIPGYPGFLEVDNGIEKIFSETQSPEFGISNLRSSQIAVASLSGFKDNQISHGSASVDGLTSCMCFLITLRKEPCAQRCSCSF